MPSQDSGGSLDRADSDASVSLGRFVDAADGQSLSDRDQTAADSDQTAADGDQTLADGDQISSDVDQRAADADQRASDEDLAHGVDPAAYERSRDVRRRTSLRREQAAKERLAVAARRDEIARARDLAALARDQASIARDLAMTALEADYEREAPSRHVTGAEVVLRAAEQRRRAAAYRARAAEHRTRSARDRDAGAADREQAAHERLQALADRKALAAQLAVAETDALTGARTRAAGLRDLDRELERCRRTSSAMVVAYVDVVGLKAVNDTDGHGAGDELLKRTVAAIRNHLRPYDLIIRLGGDEFLCAMTTMTIVDARARFSEVAAALAKARGVTAIRHGFAELEPDDSCAELIARADRELLDNRV
jgi:diguanylate cyclase (GGDEF)-like protein